MKSAFLHRLTISAIGLLGIAAAHAQDDVLNLYSARHYQTDEQLIDGFTKKTGIKINRLEADDNALLERLRNEGKASPADVILMVDAAAFQRMAHPDGELATAYAASMQEAGMVLSTQASVSLEKVAQAVSGEPNRGPIWFQLYFQPDRGFTRELVQRAEQAGYEALAVTVDAPCSGVRDRERRAGFKLPPGISAVNLAGMPPDRPLYLGRHQSRMFDGLMAVAPAWSDIEWLQGVTRLPILLKGVMHPDDARLAREAGLAGVIVSNHGGRTLDTVPATAAVLPRIRDALDNDFPLLVDGGIRRGTDILKAIALGADAVLIGRPYVFALANAGGMGVSHVLRLLRDELEIAMALCGCTTLGEARSGRGGPKLDNF